MRIPPKQNRIPRIHHWTRGGQDRPSQDTSYMALDNTQENQEHPMLPRILQLLPTMYRRFQQDSQGTIRENKEGMNQQRGIGRQTTTIIRPIKALTHHSTSTGILRPPHTDQNLNRRLKIPLLRYSVKTMPGQQMETSGIPIQDNVRRQMHLRYT